MNKKKKRSYDPNARLGYEMIRNIDQMRRIDAANLIRGKEFAQYIDSKLNVKEREWERTQQQEKLQADRLSNLLKKNKSSIINQLAEASNVTGGIFSHVGDADADFTATSLGLGLKIGHIHAKDIPDMPENYRVSDVFKDQWNSFFGEMNHLQAEDARGYQTRAANDKALIRAYNESLDKLDEIDTINIRLLQLLQIDKSDFTTGQLLVLNAEVDSLILRKDALQKEYDALAPQRKQLEDTTKQSSFGATWDHIVAGNEYYGNGGLTGVFGSTTALHDELNDARRFLYNLGDGDLSRIEKRRILNRALKEYDYLNEGWNNIIEENEAQAKYYKDKVTPWFKAQEENASTDFFDPDTYLFKMPGILGGSASSYMKQIPGMLAALAGHTAAGVSTGGLSVGASLVGALGSFGFFRGAGISENNAEVALAAKEKIKNKTGLTDEEIDDILSGKDTDIRKLRKIQDNIKNSENLFKLDMAATTWDAAIGAALGAVPIGSIARMSKWAKGTKAFERAMKNPAVKRAMESRFGKDFIAGYNALDVTSPIGGVVGGLSNATIGRLAKNGGNFVVKKASNSAIGNLGRKLERKLAMLAKASKNVDPADVYMRRGMLNGTRSQYVKGIGGRLIKSGISEGIEEGKQHTNADAFKNDLLSPEIQSIFETGLTDMINGITMGAYVLGIPLDGLGIINIKDKDLLAEIKGGMLGGWGHTAAINTVGEIAPYIRELSANDIVLELIYKDKFANISDFYQYKNWIQKGLFKPGYREVQNAFDRLRELNNTRSETEGEKIIPDALIDQAEEDYKRVISIAQDPLTRKEAENAGINVRSLTNPSSWKSNEEYQEYVALKALARKSLDEKRKNRDEAVRQAQDVENKIKLQLSLWQDEAYEELLLQLQSNDEDNVRLSRTNRIAKNAEASSDTDFMYTSGIAKLAALLEYRRQIELGLEAQKDNPNAKVKRGLKDQLAKINAQIEILSKESTDLLHSVFIDLGHGYTMDRFSNETINTLNDLESKLVYNQEEHEELKEAYINMLKWEDEYDSSRRSYENLTGKILRIDNETKEGRDLTADDLNWNPRENLNEVLYSGSNAKDIILNLHDMEESDDDFESAIEKVYQEDLKAEHLYDQNGVNNQYNVNPRNVRPVNDGHGNQIIIEIDENGMPSRQIAKNEFIDDLGRLWEYVDGGRSSVEKYPFEQRKTEEEIEQQIHQSFRDTFTEITGQILPFAYEYNAILHRKRFPIETSLLSGSTPPKKQKNQYLSPSIEIIKSDDLPEPDNVIDQLNIKYLRDKELVKNDKDGYHTTGLDYFILEDGNVVRMSRVHSVKPQSYEKQEEIAAVTSLVEKLKEAKSLDEIKDIVNEYGTAENLHYKINPYFIYLEDNSEYFFNNPTPEWHLEYITTLEHIAKEATDRWIGASIKVGNIVDELSRLFFSSDLLYKLTSQEEGILLLFESINESENKTYAQLFNLNYDNFSNTVKQLRDTYSYYTEELEWELYATPLTWRAKFNIGWVAGETDLIGIDKDGNIHIIDFKTSKDSFYTEEQYNANLTNLYEESHLSSLTEADFKNGKLSKKARDVISDIRNKSGIRNISIKWHEGQNGISGKAVVYNKNNRFLQINNQKYGQKLSAYNDYKNQQTTYARMISVETGNSVASIEILPFHCIYAYNGAELKHINSINIQDRILLPFSSKMDEILNSDLIVEDNSLNKLKQDVYLRYEELISKRNDLYEKVDSIFDDLSDLIKVSYSDYISEINNINIPDNANAEQLLNLYNTIQGLLEQYGAIEDKINKDYISNIDDKFGQEELGKNQEDVNGQIQAVRAENKNVSYGNFSHTNLNYLQVEADRDLEIATISPDFIENADFELYIEGDEVYVDISHNGKTWKHIQIDTKYHGDRFTKGKKLFDAIKKLQEKKQPGQRIVPIRSTMNRTTGAIKIARDKNGTGVYRLISETDLFANEDIFDIEFSKTYGQIGYVDNGNRAVTFDQGDRNIYPVYVWKNPLHTPKKGTLIYVKKVKKNEINGYSNIPIALDRIKLQENDVDFIIQLLLNPDLLDRPYYAELAGEQISVVATGRQLANLLIPIVDNKSDLSNILSVYRDPNNTSLIRLANRTDVASNFSNAEEFDLSTQQGVDRLKQSLLLRSISELHDVLSTRLGSDTNPLLPFEGIRRFFNLYGKNKNIRTIRISDSLLFDVDDFALKKSSKGVQRSGINGFAYYLKHNLLITQYAEMGSCNVEIQDVTLEDKSATEILPNASQQPTSIGSTTQIIDSDDINDMFLLKKQTKKPIIKLSRERAERHLKSILGDSVPVEFLKDFLAVSGCNAHVVGNCKADAIQISSFAGRATDYHEAFHRIFELLIPEKERDTIYERIASTIGIQLKNENGEEIKENYRLVAEYAADMYMDFMKYHLEVKIPLITKLWNKIHDWVFMWNRIEDRDLYNLFIEINDGKYKNAKPSQKAIDRFNRLYENLHFTISGVDFNHIVNLPMYDKLKETAMMCILMGQNVDKSGRNIQEIGRHIDKETFMAGTIKLLKLGHDVLGQESEHPTVSQLAMREIYDNLYRGSIRDDIADSISFISTDYVKNAEDESIENADGGDSLGASIGEHTRASYEFSRFDKTTSRVRFFFATIPDTTYKEVKKVNDDGSITIVKLEVLALNELGMPTFVPVNAVFNEVLNFFHDVDTVYELMSRMQRFAKDDPMYKRLYEQLKRIYSSAYQVVDGKIVRNSDYEALISQLMNVIRSNRNKFLIAKAEQKRNSTPGLGMYTITILATDSDYNAKFYPDMWGQTLVSGATPMIKIDKFGRVVINPKLKSYGDPFSKLANVFDHSAVTITAENGSKYKDVGIKQWLENSLLENPDKVYLRLKVGDKHSYYTDPTDTELLEVVKDKIIELLNSIGINFSKAELKYMLRHKYGSDDNVALYKMFNSTDITDSITSFITFLKSVVSNDKVNPQVKINGKRVLLKNAYSKLAFVRNLANWKYQYRHSRDQLTVIATGNNKFYEISDNNYLSDMIRIINKRGLEFEEIKKDIYSYFEDIDNTYLTGEIPVYGSRIIQELSRDDNKFLSIKPFVGFKTDRRGDHGYDYFEMSEREDYVAKATMLQNGGIILPTLSDKKSYFYLSGVNLPGLNYSNIIDKDGNIMPLANIGEQFVLYKDPISQLENMLSLNYGVIDQFISYAYSEYYSIKKADRDLDQMEKDGTKEKEVDNFYTKEQGAKFSSLLGVWEYEYKTDKDGTRIISGEKYYSFNNNKKSRKLNIKEAEKRFFNKSREEQEVLISRLLHKILLKEILKCVRLGLIEKVGDSDNIFYNYANIGLDSNAITSIYKALIAKNGNPVDANADNKYKSLATIIYINDISVKSIMSLLEIERVFSGNPSFYKWNYSGEGKLIDRTVDELKRLGGVNSTGNNNFMDIHDVPQKYLDSDGNFTGEYVCAQVENEMIASPQINDLKDLILHGEYTTALYIQLEDEAVLEFENYIRDSKRENPDFKISDSEYNDRLQNIRIEISNNIDNLSINEIKDQLNSVSIDICERKAKLIIDSLSSDIDVADGAAYITDEMAEMLLRMNGNYSSEIEKAFKILREELTSTILQKQQAYLAIQTSVIGTQKYTAFGRRLHQKTGVYIPYYNKMALFPLFKCMATGKMANVFEKMKEQGIDMLMVNSAVKLGGQGSKPINWDSYSLKEGDGKPIFRDSFQFDTYSQKFLYLRKQLNTDPREEVFMNVGSLMTKIAMVNLLDGRMYTTQDGVVISGAELRDDIMNAINELSNRGLTQIYRRFFKTDSDGNLIDKDGNLITEYEDPIEGRKKVLDPVKFSKELRALLSSKNPDSNIISALQIVELKDDDGNVTKHLRLPLNAISNSSWLESNIISAINKKVIDIETTGAAFILRSVWGMEGSAMFDIKKGQILGDENLSPEINGGDRLQMVNEEGSMDCVLSADYIKKMLGGDIPLVPIKDKNRNVIWDLIPELDSRGNAKKDESGKIIYSVKKDKDGNVILDKNGNPVYRRKMRMREMTFDELRNWLIKRGIIGKNATANIIGYRIPTQAQSSIHALRCVDIIPAVNDTVILPAEFTKITGSDFDIDKLFLSSIRYKVNRILGEDGKYHQTVTSEFKDTEDAYYQNKIIRNYITLLLDWKSYDKKEARSTNILHRPIDNDTKLIKDILSDIESSISKEEEIPYGFYSLSTQTSAKNDYITGKIGIGPFALNNNNHVLTMLYHVRFKHIESSIMSELGLERLDRKTDDDGESIMSWISALINAHVDIARDPYISRLNVNPFTYNLVNLLIRTGLGGKTFYFTSQPIMKELAAAYINAQSLYMSDPHTNIYKLQEQALDAVANEWFAKNESITFEGYTAKELIDIIKEGGRNNTKIRSSVNKKIHELFNDDLRSDAKKTDMNIENQFFYYLAYLLFDHYAKALSSLVTYSKIDTKKHGKSVIEQIVYKDGYDRTYDTLRESNLFEPNGLNQMREKSYIGTKTDNGINAVSDILSGQFILSSPAFLRSLDSIIKAVGRGESLSTSLIKSASDALSAAIKSKFFVEEYVPQISNNPNFIRDLVSESQESVLFVVQKQGNAILVSGEMFHDLQSYCIGKIQLQYLTQSGKYNVIPPIQIIGVDESTNTIYVDKIIPQMYGKAILIGGQNTIYDRFNRLLIDIRSNPRYSKLLNASGNVANYLLDSMIFGKEYRYMQGNIIGELPDTYNTLKFVKLFNFVDDGAITSNYIINAWEELLSYTDENKDVENTVREFARDLIVYAFITSGDKVGFTKMFKYVPTSWRESSGYGNYIYSKLTEYQIGNITDIDIDDVILNNWYDNQLVPTYKLIDKVTRLPLFMKYYTKRNGVQLGYPTILAALKNENGKLIPSINVETAPKFIKIQRRKDTSSIDSQRRFTVYKLHNIARSKDGVAYPVYIKVNPKGMSLSEGFMVTEYGRSDAINVEEYYVNEEILSGVYKASNVGQHILINKNTEPEYSAIIQGLRRAYEEVSRPVSLLHGEENNNSDVRDELRKTDETSTPTIINESSDTKEHEQC